MMTLRRTIPFLLTMGLCALIHAAYAPEIQMHALIPEEKNVHMAHLSNGVKMYIQENHVLPEAASVRIVLRNLPEEEIHAFNGEAGSVGQFFDFFKERLSKRREGQLNSFKGYHYWRTDLPVMSLGSAQEIAVIVVGNFQLEEMQELVARNFGNVELCRKESGDSLSSIRIDSDEGVSRVALRVSFPNLHQTIYTPEELKESWRYLVLQELLQQRMERSSRGLDEAWVHPHPRFFYPVNGYAFSTEGNSEHLLSFLLWQIHAIRNDGFFEDEFAVAKHRLIDQLQYLSSSAGTPDNAFLASYYADQFLLGDRCLDVSTFFDDSVQLVQEMQSSELLPCLSRFLLDSKRQIQIVYPSPKNIEPLNKDGVEQLIQRVASLSSFYQKSEIREDTVQKLEVNETHPQSPTGKEAKGEDSGFIQLIDNETPAEFLLADSPVAEPPQNNSSPVDPFYQLPLTEKEKRFIKIIVSTMAEKNIIQLALEKHSLEKKGDRVHHVHPMRFIGYILSHHELKDHLKVIKKSSFKWDAFVDGFSKRMREEYRNNNLYVHVPGFAQLLNASQGSINHYIEKKDWEGLIKSLL